MFRTMLAAGVASLAILSASPALADDHTASSGEVVAPAIEFERWTLDNGLQVIAIPDASTGTVTTSMWYEVGSKSDPEGRSGFAHLFEHILSRKTLNMPYNLIYGLTADVGGTRNATTNADRTNYFEIVPAEYLEAMLWTHRERMAFPVIDQDVFDKERDVVKEELRQRVYAPPYGRFSSFVIPETTYDALPYRRPTIGSIEELDSAELDDARAFHQAYYGPDTATLIVAGNFEVSDLRQLVDEYFADIPRRENPVEIAFDIDVPERTEARSVTATAPNVPLPLVGTVWKLPSITHPDGPALLVLDAIMARGQNSRMQAALVRSGKAVQAIHEVGLQEEGGVLAQFAVINPQANVDEVRGILEAERERVKAEGVTEAELAEAKNELLATALRQRETARGRAFELGEALLTTGDPSFPDKRLAGIAAVTTADVQRVAQTYYDPDARTDILYTAGEDDPSSYANPYPMPTFKTLPPATGEPLAVAPEGVRETVPGPGQRPQLEAAPIVEATLANGIEVVATQTGDVPLATMTVLVPGGSISDPRAKAGLAQMTAQLADKGAAGFDETEIARRLESLGASFGATAGSQGSFFSLTAPVANLEEAGKVLATIITSADYPADAFERERKRAIDGLAASLKDPGALAGMAARPVLYGDSPYGTLPGGTQASLAELTREDLVEHRRAYWHPARAQVIVSGGIAPEQAIELTSTLLGDWQGEGEPPVEIANPTGAAEPVRTVVIDMPDAGQAAVYAGMRAPSRQAGDYYAIELANAILGGGSSGRLFEEVRTKRSISYGAGSGLGTDMLLASSQTQNSTADEVVQVFLDEFDRLGDEAIAADLLDRRRLYLGGNYARSLESSAGFNSIVANLLLDGLEPAEAARYADRLAAVSPEAATKAAADYVGSEKATIIIVGNADEFLDDLKAIRPNVEVIDAETLDLSSKTLTFAVGD
ncbi:pitrilysin family protein [Qipengyuania sp. XHP0207]|uniref:M16 family metallopeptidase n=1 Tax=Qipengyuania sp. XHP0207 TaxID=3038078 RepID=UPI00241E6909|nr:pitrilysin family protein [Qipengyuania sp. XHP0207]MDG5746803.1 pitrilysin family protein [Qipengyuania sp. XHP0207]